MYLLCILMHYYQMEYSNTRFRLYVVNAPHVMNWTYNIEPN